MLLVSQFMQSKNYIAVFTPIPRLAGTQPDETQFFFYASPSSVLCFQPCSQFEADKRCRTIQGNCLTAII